MKNRMMASLATLAVTGTVVVLGGGVANASGCAPSHGTEDQIGTWVWDAFSAWSPDTTAPADPDGQSGLNNMLNLQQVGEGWRDTHDPAYRQQVSDGWVRFTAWQTSEAPPAVGANEEAGHRYQQTVGNGDATEGLPGFWQNFEPNKDQGSFDGPPSYPTDPRGTWGAKTTHGGPQQDAQGVYQNGNGNSSWFYRSQGSEGQSETTHVEYRWDVYAFHYEYRWSMYERVNLEGTDRETCGTADGETPVADPDERTDLPGELPVERTEPLGERTDLPAGTKADDQSVDNALSVVTPAVHFQRSAQSHHRAAASTAVPTSIDAGL